MFKELKNPFKEFLVFKERSGLPRLCDSIRLNIIRELVEEEKGFKEIMKMPSKPTSTPPLFTWNC